MMENLLTTRQLQALLQVDRITIYRMLSDGRLQGFKVGGQWRFSRQAVEAWLHEQQIGLEAGPAVEQGGPAAPPAGDLPLSCMQSILDILADALGIGALLAGPDGAPLTRPSNTPAFCRLLLDSAARPHCIRWWQSAAGRLGPRVQMLTCHAGLHYACARIDVRGRPVAALCAGQFLDHPPVPGDAAPAHLAEWAAPLAEVRAALPVLNEAGRRHLLSLLPRVVAALSEIGEERVALLDRLRRIAAITNLENAPISNDRESRREGQ